MSTRPVRRWLLAGAAWLLAVGVATAGATAAVGSLGQGIFGSSGEPMTEAEVAALLASAPAPSAGVPSAGVSPPVGTPLDVTTRALTTPGGTIVAACDGGQVTLRSWTVNAGYEADHVRRGPAAVASLRFKARGGGGDVRAQVTCDAGGPVLSPAGDD